jgi:hypothetical protein
MHSSCGKVTAVFLLVIVFLTVARRYNSTHFPLVLLEKCEHILAVVFFKDGPKQRLFMYPNIYSSITTFAPKKVCGNVASQECF